MIFRKSKGKCPECGSATDKDWDFCPRCGAQIKEKSNEDIIPSFGSIDSMFNQIERRMQQQMKEMDRLFGESMFAKPKFIMPKGGSGISISIHSGPAGPPKVSVKTFGEAKKFEPKIRQQLGMRQAIKEVEEKPTKPKVTAEPEMKIRKEGGKTVYEISLPDIKNEKDIQVSRLPNSVEVRARAGDKLYFKLFEAPQSLEILEKTFENGKLVLVLG